MNQKALQLQIDDRGVATVTLNRPHKHNALSASMIAELSLVAVDLEADPLVRIVILAAAGKSFCAGADLNWIREQFAATRAQRMDEARKLAQMLRQWNRLSRPVIARVQGAAYGGGIGLMAVCDTVVAASTARFGLTESRLGLIPATIAPYVIARIGAGTARRVFPSAAIFDAETARSLGLITEVVTDEAMDEAITAEVDLYLQAAPSAVAACKKLVQSLAAPITDEVIQNTIERLADTWETAAAREGVTAFFERRKPPWISKQR